MHAGVGFHRRLGIEGEFDAVALLRNGEQSGVNHSVKRIALFLRVHSVPDRKAIVKIKQGQQRNGDDDCTFQDQLHALARFPIHALK